jgi:hypothetical protein
MWVARGSKSRSESIVSITASMRLRSGPWGTTERKVPLSPGEAAGGAKHAVVQRRVLRFACVANASRPVKGPPSGALRSARSGLAQRLPRLRR